MGKRNFLSTFNVLFNADDETLMAKVIEGNQAAFEKLYRKYRGPIMNYIGTMVFDSNQVEEMAQETFFKVYRKRSLYDGKYKFRSWLWTIARNTALDYLRKKRDLRIEDISSPDQANPIGNIPDESSGVEEQLIQQVDRALVQRCLDRLAIGQKEVFMLRTMSEMTYTEIAEIVDKSESSVKSLIFRARIAFIEELKVEQEKEEK
jgi:RNA polymerase sigma-70 factor (ECF subfamily)